MENLQSILQNPEVYKINRLDAHSDHLFYENEASAAEKNATLFYPLNGTWKFKYSKNIADRPADFYKTGFDLSGFGEIEVPSHIQMSGHDNIHYVNTMYPWDGVCNLRPPFVDEDYNPVGSYTRFFDLPQNFNGKSVCISFKGVEQAFSLYLNGEFVGYAEDSFTPSDFDLTPYLKNSGNYICVEVYKKSSAAWLEDQDFFRFSGIFRDVILYAKPKVHIEDLWVCPKVCDDLKSGEFSFKIKTDSEPNISFTLKDCTNNIVLSEKPSFTYSEQQKTEEAENDIKYYESPKYNLCDVTLWDISNPNLYKLTINVYDENGDISEVVVQEIGFRHFVIRDAVMYLNGERLIINGVNRHEWNPEKGRAISNADMEADIDVFLRNNISAVRTSHYPNNSYFYELCDKNGIIVMDETNLETHGSWQKMGAVEPSWNVPRHDKKWQNCVIDRAVSMFERDKNHPSILWWSCGNESYSGEVILAMANYFRRKDSLRYVHYESCFYDDDYSDCTDIYSRMYAEPEEIDEFLSIGYDKPYIVCEYMHNMGNSIGGMESYIKLLDKHKSYQGGFIWDYMDQAIYTEKGGIKYLGYGGDFADRPTDYNFSGNGIVFADRTEKPAMQEVKYWYSTPLDRKKHDEKNTSAIKNMAVNHAIDNSKTFEVIKGDCNLGVKGENFSVLFSYVEGGIVSLKYSGYEWLYRASKPIYWRALTENDTANGFAQKSGLWNFASMYQKHIDIKITEENDNFVTIEYTFDTLIGTKTQVAYTVYSDGTIKVSAKLNGADLPDLALFGMNFITQDRIADYEYTGYSGETYPDRFKGGVFGKYTEKVKTADYLMPQENGCHVYSHGVKLIGTNSELNFKMCDTPFHFSVLDNSAQELESATHKHELPNTGHTHVRIMSKMRGVGGINTWGADVEKEYHISAKDDIVLEFFITKS